MWDFFIDDGKKVISFCEAHLLALDEINKKMMDDKKLVIIDKIELENEDFDIII
jgi:hypothetical protein